MNNYIKFSAFLLVIEIVLIISCNLLFNVWEGRTENAGRLVDIKRAADEIRNGVPVDEIDLNKYKFIVKISVFDPEERCSSHYSVEKVGGVLYRFEYRNGEGGSALLLNAAMGIFFIISVILLIYIGKKVIYPFHSMNYLCEELAKGNLSVPIKAEKNKFFGRFLWGMDMLRETLEDSKFRELELVRDKKTLLLSLSHDIKTPLFAIDLYTKALMRNLYDTEEKRRETVCGIERNTAEIKKYVDEITDAAREDFLSLKIDNGEFYLDDLMRRITRYYAEKTQLGHTEFLVAKEENCLLYGDVDRVVEVMQNVVENAIKYGDGKKIGISFDEEEDFKLVTVENSGAVPHTEEMAHIFDSFYRGSNAGGKKGSGLGLYICRELLHKMDGDIFAKADGESFCVTIVLKKM